MVMPGLDTNVRKFPLDPEGSGHAGDWLFSLFRDIHQASRMLRRNAGYSLALRRLLPMCSRFISGCKSRGS